LAKTDLHRISIYTVLRPAYSLSTRVNIPRAKCPAIRAVLALHAA
jgi:hypothetical protein